MYSVPLTTQITPNLDEFRNLSSTYNVIPVYCEIIADTETPVSALAKLDTESCAWLLESVDGGETLGRYSFLGNSFYQTFAARGHEITIQTGESKITRVSADPLNDLNKLVTSYRVAPVSGLPKFFGGAVGYIAYDAVRYSEQIPDQNPDPLNLPDLCFLLTDIVLIFDHVSRRLLVVVNARVQGDPDAVYQQALATIQTYLARLQATPDQATWFSMPQDLPNSPVISSFPREQFVDAVKRAKDYISAGDAFQVVLSQRLSIPISTDPMQVYRALRSLNPSPYMFFLKMPGVHIAGASPEVLVRVEGRRASLRPIAGTRRRGKNQEEDASLRSELLKDEKEIAEHIMLVDLGRNDLGRVCETGSVQVTNLMSVEQYSHVMHIVSQVQGQLGIDKSPFDVLRATFPAGTVSGAPKIRAMEIIDELEPLRRGPYGGGIGYFGYNGNMDICITIRTVVVKDQVAHVQAGAGIVADSDPEREYDETLAKAQAVLKAIQAAEVANL